jgi:hypothetical protein
MFFLLLIYVKEIRIVFFQSHNSHDETLGPRLKALGFSC